jgi:methylthioribose-1-phosphate isomerase
VLTASRDPAAVDRACATLKAARPTAVNLTRAVDRVRAAADPLDEARALESEERAASEAIARHGAQLLAGARRVLTHCNTGALAAPGRGTALAVIAELAAQDRLESVLVCETRPLLQGARLTTWELGRLDIAFELIVDSAAPGLIAGGAADAVIVGCDRVAANGDVANKVGTYGLALAARAAGIPFVVAGPSSTIDETCATGAQITIEERSPDEVQPATPCRNPAFDVTPAELVTALVTEHGVSTAA